MLRREPFWSAGSAAAGALVLSLGALLMWPEVRVVASGYSSIGSAAANGVYPIVLLLLVSPFFTRGRFVGAKEARFFVRAAGVAGLVWSADLARAFVPQASLDFVALCGGVFSASLVVYPRAASNAKTFLAFAGVSLATALPSVYLVTPLSEAYGRLVTAIAAVAGLNVSMAGQLIMVAGRAGPAVAFVEDGCTGIAATAIFLVLFALLLKETKRTWRQTLPLAVGGVVALQLVNLLRMMLTLTVGDMGGWLQMEKYHSVAGYMMFVLFYAVFVLVFLAKYERSYIRGHQTLLRVLTLFVLGLILLTTVGTVVASTTGAYSDVACTTPVTTASATSVHGLDSGSFAETNEKGDSGTWNGTIYYVNPSGSTVLAESSGTSTGTNNGGDLTVTWFFCGTGLSATSAGVWTVSVTNSVTASSVKAGTTISPTSYTDTAVASFTITATPDFGFGGVPLLLLAGLVLAGAFMRKRTR